MPLDPAFQEVNRRAIAAGIRKALLEQLEATRQVVETSDFENDFYGDTNNALVMALLKHFEFMRDVPVEGWTYMQTDADTSGEMEQAYTYLTSKGVSFEED